MCNLVLIGRMVPGNMFENNGHIHLFSSVAGTDKTLVSFFHKHKHKCSVNLVICCKITPPPHYI